MELYILDDQFRRDSVIDTYISLVWAERYSSVGDFVLVVQSSREFRNSLIPDVWLALSSSYRVMRIETIEDGVSDEGDETLVIRGQSMEVLLTDRVAMDSTSGLTLNPKWVLTGLPGDIVRNIFDVICVQLQLSPRDGIPFYTSTPFLSLGTIPEPFDSVQISLGPDTLYNSIKQICDMYGLGFRLVRNGDTSQVHFDVFTGFNRTSTQQVNSPVIFSPTLDNLSNTKSLISTALYKNLALVFAPNGVEYVYPDNISPETVTGFNRRALVVTATDITLPAGPELTLALVQKGKEELAKCRIVKAFDGEIPQDGSYRYQTDYDLGDLVEVRNIDGLTTVMRVTEQIFSSDKDGDKSYPTLVVDSLIEPGSWYAWDNSQVWDDAIGVWDDV